MKTLNIEKFVNSYLATAAWITIESGECDEFTKEAKEVAEFDCRVFINKVMAAFPTNEARKILTTPGSDLDYLAPHDFFLTRNRHGAGFWDQEKIYGEDAAKKLTEICHELGEINCYHVRGKKSKLTFN